jgi:hypothetical protein
MGEIATDREVLGSSGFNQLTQCPGPDYGTASMRPLGVWQFSIVAGFIATCVQVFAEDSQIASDKRALAALQTYIGQWRGVGQPKRGSSQGAWTERYEWTWKFDQGRAQLCATLDHDRYYSRLCLEPGDGPNKFVLKATSPVDSKDQADQHFLGTLSDGVLEMVDTKATGERPARITVRMVADGDRMLVLYEKRLGNNVYGRLAEIGATRKGSSFAKNAASGPECVVTGGLGTIAVEHNGKKYFVCCSGCKDLFNDDPEGVLADYRARKAVEAAEKANR